MVGIKYIRYQYKKRVSKTLGVITWSSLTAFMLFAKNSLGINNVPIFELVIFVASLASVFVVYRVAVVPHRIMVLIDAIIEIIFLAVLYYSLYNFDIAVSAVIVYGVITINAVTSYFMGESKQEIEHNVLTRKVFKKHLKVIREIANKTELIGGAIGSSIALIALTYYKADIVDYAMVMLALNVLEIFYSLFIWNKYLR